MAVDDSHASARDLRYRSGMRIGTIAAMGGALALAACQKPDPPQLSIDSVQVTGVDTASIGMHVGVAAFNPNRIPLSAQRVTGHVFLDDKYDLGSATVATPIAIPAGQTVRIDVPLSVRWSDLSLLGIVAARPDATPFVVKGTVTIGGDHISFDLPFEAKGAITREQLASAALRGLPGMLQGLPVPAIPAPPAP